MKRRVERTRRARAQAKAAHAWWKANRTASPELFRQEFREAVELMASSPGVGTPYPDAGIPGLRRLILPKTRFHVYYVHDPMADYVLVVAVWSALRGRPPELG